MHAAAEQRGKWLDQTPCLDSLSHGRGARVMLSPATNEHPIAPLIPHLFLPYFWVSLVRI